jgi:hypothetical protein
VRSNQTALDATAGFEVGTRTTVDVLDARRRLFEAERDYARSRYDYLINIVRLESAAGGLQQDDLDAINGLLTQPTTLPVSGRVPAGSHTRPGGRPLRGWPPPSRDRGHPLPAPAQDR